MRPAAAADYAVTIPEAVAEAFTADELKASPEFVDFIGKMHELGLSQKQLDGVVGEMLVRSVGLQETLPVLAEADCVAELQKTWTTPDDYSKNVGAAYRAGKHYAGEDFEAIMADLGNDPRIVRMLAKVGAEMSEDRPAMPGAGGAVVQNTLEELMASKAYLNASDPQHQLTRQRVEQLTARLVGNGPAKASTQMSFKSG